MRLMQGKVLHDMRLRTPNILRKIELPPMNDLSDYEGFSVWLYGTVPSEPAVFNDQPFTLGSLATVLLPLVNSVPSEETWQQTAGWLQQLLAPGKGTAASSLASEYPHDSALELSFNVVGGTLMTPAQGTMVILRKGSDFCYASISLSLNPWMLSGPEEWLDRLSYDLYWAALLSGYDGNSVRGGEEPESGNRVMIFENEKTHCVLLARYFKKPANVMFYVQPGLFGQK